MHQNWMGDYDPTLGSYVQADPLGLVDGPSVYRYATANPGRYVDPRGLQSTLTANGPMSLPETSSSALPDIGKVVKFCLKKGGGFITMLVWPNQLAVSTCPAEICSIVESKPHTPDQQALGELIKEGTRGGRRFDDDEADAILD